MAVVYLGNFVDKLEQLEKIGISQDISRCKEDLGHIFSRDISFVNISR